ncbi:MAG: hypothetical protein Q7J31_15640 [Syntrophales bacterium]|uniref:hypothetical protein n=1 Tax=Candidatus Wunengus sp. YC61 TaxID=3367698 RepID=UPI00271F4D55|nr:hypothetical protein [Syntrophales bacterium]
MLASNVLKNQGIDLNIVGDELRLSPKKKVTPEIIEFARAHKPQIITELNKANTITPLEIVEPGANVKATWRNPYPEGTKEARIGSLTQIMGAIFQESFKKVREIYEQSGTQFNGTPEILNTEQRIETLQRAVLNGEAKLNDFQLAVHEWERASKAILN